MTFQAWKSHSCRHSQKQNMVFFEHVDMRGPDPQIRLHRSYFSLSQEFVRFRLISINSQGTLQFAHIDEGSPRLNGVSQTGGKDPNKPNILYGFHHTR